MVARQQRRQRGPKALVQRARRGARGVEYAFDGRLSVSARLSVRVLPRFRNRGVKATDDRFRRRAPPRRRRRAPPPRARFSASARGRVARRQKRGERRREERVRAGRENFDSTVSSGSPFDVEPPSIPTRTRTVEPDANRRVARSACVRSTWHSSARSMRRSAASAAAPSGFPAAGFVAAESELFVVSPSAEGSRFVARARVVRSPMNAAPAVTAAAAAARVRRRRRAKPRVLAQQTKLLAQRGEERRENGGRRRDENGGFGHRSATTQFRGRGSARPLRRRTFESVPRANHATRERVLEAPQNRAERRRAARARRARNADASRRDNRARLSPAPPPPSSSSVVPIPPTSRRRARRGAREVQTKSLSEEFRVARLDRNTANAQNAARVSSTERSARAARWVSSTERECGSGKCSGALGALRTPGGNRRSRARAAAAAGGGERVGGASTSRDARSARASRCVPAGILILASRLRAPRLRG